MRVLIIGAGLGGLCLAHGLRAAGIEVRVFERGPELGAQPASYGIHLNADGLRALHAALPDTNWEQFVATTVPAKNIVRFHDPTRGVLASLDLQTAEHAIDPVTRRRAVTRGNLRDALVAGLDHDVIGWERRFVSYEILPDGRVRADFADGTSEVGDLLVGADGSNSAVRSQRHPALRRQDLGILNVAGRLTVTPELERVLPTEFTDSGINNVVPAGAGWMFVSTWSTGDSAATSLEGAEDADRYLIWAWAARTDSYPRRGDLTGRELKDHVAAQIAGWSKPLQTMVAATPPEAVGPVPLRTMPQLPEWEANQVTVLGDAIHNMTPMGGIGANTALRDADALRRAVRGHRDSAIDAVTEYEAAMRVYANAALQVSTRNAERAANPARGRRAVFRTLLKLAEAVPFVKRRIFHTPAASDLASSRPVEGGAGGAAFPPLRDN